MATKNTALRNALADAFGNVWNSGTLVIKTAGGVTLATFNLTADAFAAASNGSCSMAGLPMSVAAVASGVAAKAELISNGATYDVTDLTVGESATQVVLDNTDINAGQTVTLNSFAYTISASLN